MLDVFGSEMPLAVKFLVAFAVVLALIGLTAWVVRRFGANRLGSSRGRQPRLAVIDAAPVDGRRRLVLIRRDNIEHLLMIGGPTDVVVEPNIVRAVGTREVAREQPPRVEPPAPARAPSPEGGAWPLQPLSEPTPMTPATAPRPYRSNATEEPWLPADAGARARPTADLSGLASELSARLNPEPPQPPLRAEPRIAPPPPPSEPVPSPQTEHNLAEMAQQLEAALRRTPMPEGRPPVTDPLAVSPKAAAEPQRIPPREPKPRSEPKLDIKPEPKLEPTATPGKALYDNLEQEMASLLGRPPGKS